MADVLIFCISYLATSTRLKATLMLRVPGSSGPVHLPFLYRQFRYDIAL